MGEKLSKELQKIIEKYTKENDLILDPFSGYGGIGIEGVLKNRNVILNDLNPIANFISKCILEKNIDFDKLNKYAKQLKEKYKEKEETWYKYKEFKIITILRDNKDIPLKIKIKDKNNKIQEIELNAKEKKRIYKERGKLPN